MLTAAQPLNEYRVVKDAGMPQERIFIWSATDLHDLYRSMEYAGHLPFRLSSVQLYSEWEAEQQALIHEEHRRAIEEEAA